MQNKPVTRYEKCTKEQTAAINEEMKQESKLELKNEEEGIQEVECKSWRRYKTKSGKPLRKI